MKRAIPPAATLNRGECITSMIRKKGTAPKGELVRHYIETKIDYDENRIWLTSFLEFF